jgi:hypothetical protein
MTPRPFIEELPKLWMCASSSIICYKATLLIEKVELHGKYGNYAKSTSLSNSPGSREFARFLDCYQLKPSEDAGGDIYVDVDSSKIDAVGLKDLLNMDLSSVRNRLTPDKAKKAKDISLGGKAPLRLAVPGQYVLEFNYKSADRGCAHRSRYAPFEEKGGHLHAKILIRSVDSAIYYVGEYLREVHRQAERSSNAVVQDYAIDGEPLFVVHEGRTSRSAVSTTLMGRSYFVPANLAERGRTTQVIALLQQLMNIHKNSDQRPTTVPVRLQRF